LEAPVTQLEPQRRTIALAEGGVSLLDWGGAGPAIHFAHANGFNAETYAPILSPLAGEARLMASDLRGHGFTTLPADPAAHTTWTTYPDDLIRVLDAIGAGPYILAGHSMGGTTSLLVAAARPDLVRALVLFDPVASQFPADIDRDAIPLVVGARRRRAVFPDAAAALSAYVGRGAFKTWPEATIAAYLRGGLKPDPEGVRLACTPAWEAQNFRLGPAGVLEAIEALTCPVTILTAAEGSTTGAGALARLRDLRPDARIEQVPGTTHFLPMERPDLVQAALRAAATAET
jgi:pimeloyl-ACP methyl ester carboxylesterase